MVPAAGGWTGHRGQDAGFAGGAAAGGQEQGLRLGWAAVGVGLLLVCKVTAQGQGGWQHRGSTGAKLWWLMAVGLRFTLLARQC